MQLLLAFLVLLFIELRNWDSFASRYTCTVARASVSPVDLACEARVRSHLGKIHVPVALDRGSLLWEHACTTCLTTLGVPHPLVVRRELSDRVVRHIVLQVVFSASEHKQIVDIVSVDYKRVSCDAETLIALRRTVEQVGCAVT